MQPCQCFSWRASNRCIEQEVVLSETCAVTTYYRDDRMALTETLDRVKLPQCVRGPHHIERQKLPHKLLRVFRLDTRMAYLEGAHGEH